MRGSMSGRVCPVCKSSKGEKSIRKYLIDNSFNFKEQYRINGCKDIKPLPFDFAVFDDNGNLLHLIEYDGKQHYETWHNVSNAKDKLIKIQKHDNIKTIYCQKNRIDLIRIPYWSFKNIQSILNDILKEGENIKYAS